MRLEPTDKENTPQEADVSRILEEYREAGEQAIPTMEDEPVRIYQPRRERRAQQEQQARRMGRDLPAEKSAEPEDEEDEEVVPVPGGALLERAGSALRGLLDRLRASRPQPEPRELLSFEELVYGKKEQPVRILEEDEPTFAPARRSEAAPAIPEEELSVNAILADYWAEPETPAAAAPVRSRRQRREEAEQARREKARADRERSRQELASRLEGFKANWKRGRESAPETEPAPEQPAPRPEPKQERPAPHPPAPQPQPQPEPRREKIRPAELSVDEILNEYWSDQTGQAAESPAPRSRRENARMREERGPLPPSGAASSAAENSLPSPRSRTPRRMKAEAPKTPEAPKPEPAPAPEPKEPETPKPRHVQPPRHATPPKAPAAAPAPEAPRPRHAAPPVPARKKSNEDVEFSAMSVDDILSEYNEIMAAMPSAVSSAASAPVSSAAGAAGGSVSRMEQEARSFIDEMKSRDFAGIREESAYRKNESAGGNEKLRRILEQDPGELPEQPAEKPAPGSARHYAAPSEEVDPRFNLSGRRRSAMVFGDKELDLSPDESYVPPKAAENVGLSWVEGEEELPEQPLRKPSLKDRLRRPRAKARPKPAEEPEEEPAAPVTEGYDDRKRPEYAPDRDYESDDEEEEAPGHNAFPSFRQYVSTLFSGMLVRLLGARRSAVHAAGTMEDETEDLGPEVSPGAASRYYGSFVTSLRMRVRIGLALMVVMAWISLGLPVTGSLRTAPVAAAMVMAIQLVILLLGLDVVTGAAVNLARGRFGADSLAVLTCVLTSIDALAVSLGVLGRPHMPLCLASSASFLGVLLSSLLSARGLRKALRVPAIGKRCYSVTLEPAVKGSGLTLLKSLRPPKGFVRRSEEAAPDESAFYRVAPILALLCLPLTLAVAVAKHAYGDFLYILTALLCPAVPLAALLCFALPFLFGSLRIFQSGAAIAGWSGITDIGRSDKLIVTDRDLFPEGSVEIDTVRIFAEMEPETIISYAGSMICASESDLAPCFAELMERNSCPMRRVEGYEYLSGGGMKGVIDGSVVLCGGVDLMRLMNVRVPFRLVGKTTVLLAVDGILCGIFNMKYEGQPQVRGALVSLIRSNRNPVFAIRDFLVTPEMLAGCFDVATDGYDFPPFVDRFAISEAKPTEDSKVAAVVCREGLGPLVHMADTGRSLYLTVRINLLLTVFAAVLGVLVVFFRLMWAGTVGSGFLLVFLLLWLIPVVGMSVFLRF